MSPAVIIVIVITINAAIAVVPVVPVVAITVLITDNRRTLCCLLSPKTRSRVRQALEQ